MGPRREAIYRAGPLPEGHRPLWSEGLCFPPGGVKGQRLRPHLPGTESGSDPLPVFTHPGDSGEAEAAPPATPCQLCLLTTVSSCPQLWPCSRLLRGEAHPAPRFPDSRSPPARGPDSAPSSTHPLPPSWLRGRELTDGPDPRKGPGLSSPITPHPLSACVWHCRAVLAGEEA